MHEKTMLLQFMAEPAHAGVLLYHPSRDRLIKLYLRKFSAMVNSSLKDGVSALKVVINAVRKLEDCPLFNAGRGAVFTRSLEHELDASIMDGKTLAAGAVAQSNALNKIRAVAATGTGETFICASTAYDLCALIDYAGLDLETVAQRAIVRQAAFNGQGGLIAVDAKSNVTMPFNTEGMYCAAVSSRFPLFTAIYR